MTTKDEAREQMRQDSGKVSDPCPLVSFLYELMRDYLPAGAVEDIVQNSVTEKSDPGAVTFYTNGWLAQYAQDIANRLLPPEPQEPCEDPQENNVDEIPEAVTAEKLVSAIEVYQKHHIERYVTPYPDYLIFERSDERQKKRRRANALSRLVQRLLWSLLRAMHEYDFSDCLGEKRRSSIFVEGIRLEAVVRFSRDDTANDSVINLADWWKEFFTVNEEGALVWKGYLHHICFDNDLPYCSAASSRGGATLTVNGGVVSADK